MYALMGASGNITSKVAALLLERGARVRVIGRNRGRLARLHDAGAELALGSALDAEFLAEAFHGAQAVYSMIPADPASPDHRRYQNAVGQATFEAIVESGVRVVVNLSSAGASLTGGTGLVAGLHDQEQRLNQLSGVDVLHLRPGYFMENHLRAIGRIKATGVYADMLAPDVPIAMIATRDVAAVVADELLRPSFKGHVVRHLMGPGAPTMTEAARILGAAIDKPSLRYVRADPAQEKAGMILQGVSPNVADLLEEMSRFLSEVRVKSPSERHPVTVAPTTLEAFAPEFARVYAGNGARPLRMEPSADAGSPRRHDGADPRASHPIT